MATTQDAAINRQTTQGQGIAIATRPDRVVPSAFLTNENEKPFASADAFGIRFALWCDQAGLKPVVCDDGKVRNFRAHGLRKAALTAAAHAGCTLHELMALGGHASPTELQKYLETVEQENMSGRAKDKIEAGLAEPSQA